MILGRLGNKSRLVDNIYPLFPQHDCRITMFFGAGGEFFNTPRAKYNVINDLDKDVFNLYKVVIEKPDELIETLTYTPVSATLLDYWKQNVPDDEILKAVRFLLISNFTYLSKGDTIKYGVGREKEAILKRIKKCRLRLGDARIMSEDFRNVLSKISFSERVLPKRRAFIYMDPIYLDTTHNYKVPNWDKTDTEDLFKIASECGIRCAISEFDHPFVIECARKYQMLVTFISNRRNIKNRRNEVLITNYEPFDLFTSNHSDSFK